MLLVRLWGEMMKDTDASEETQVKLLKYELHMSIVEINSLWRQDQYCCLQKSISSPSASVWMKPKELRQKAAELVLWVRSCHGHSDNIYNPELQPRRSEHHTRQQKTPLLWAQPHNHRSLRVSRVSTSDLEDVQMNVSPHWKRVI